MSEHEEGVARTRVEEPEEPAAVPLARETPRVTEHPRSALPSGPADGELAESASERTRARRALGCLVVLFLLAAAGAGLSLTVFHKPGKPSNPRFAKSNRPIPVTVAHAIRKVVPVELHAVGNVTPYSTVPVTAQVTGQLKQVFFKQGDFVKKGAPLFAIDSRPQEASLDQVQAAVARDQAQIHQAQAQVMKDRALIRQAHDTLGRDLAQQRYARSEETRYATLVTQGYVTMEQYGQQKANADAYDATIRSDRSAIAAAQATMAADEATVRSLQANMHADQASVENASIQLGYTFIRSPLSGRTGALNSYQGALIRANDTTPLVTIDQLSPVYVSFSVPEEYMPQLRQYQRSLVVQATTAGETGPPEMGRVDFIDSRVDTTTGTIMLRGRFANLRHRLWPGRFTNVVMEITRQASTLIPSQAVNPGQNGPYVFVVKPDQTVEARSVTTGQTIDNMEEIKRGIRPGETVVTDGQLQLRPGSKIAIQGPGRPGMRGARPGTTGAGTAGRRHRGRRSP